MAKLESIGSSESPNAMNLDIVKANMDNEILDQSSSSLRLKTSIKIKQLNINSSEDFNADKKVLDFSNQ